MSRIGKSPVSIPKGVEIRKEGNLIKVKGTKGELSQHIDSDITVDIQSDKVVLSRPTDHKRHRSLHGLYRALIANMVKGVSDGINQSKN